jgi:hypothetical protein
MRCEQQYNVNHRTSRKLQCLGKPIRKEHYVLELKSVHGAIISTKYTYTGVVYIPSGEL